MFRKLIIALFILFTVNMSHAMEKIQGKLTGVLRAQQSPYMVTGDIEVPALDSLVIEPGVSIYFDSLYAFEIRGTLHANGAAGRSIAFSSHTKKAGAWKGIRFRSSATVTSQLKHCSIQFAQVGVYIASTSPKITDNVITDNSQHGIQCRVSSAQISGNKIGKNNWDGLALSSYNGLLEKNTIIANGDDGIDLKKSTGTIRNNVIQANKDDGIVCNVSSPFIVDNLITQNGDDGILLKSSTPKIVNNVLARQPFGLFGYAESKPLLSNLTIVENQYGVYIRDKSHPVIDSSILWHNETNVFSDSLSAVSISYSDVEGGFAGKKNFSKEPQILDAASYLLSPKSPCRGAGNPRPMIDHVIEKKLVGAQLSSKTKP